MQLHHKLQPHHHVAIWAVSSLLVILAAAVYSNASIQQILAGEPSESTKKFFGFDKNDEGGGQWTMPAECQQNPNQDKMQQLSSEMQNLSNQMNSLNSQLNTLVSQDTSGMTDEQKATHEQQITSLQSQIQTLQNQIQQKQSEMNLLQSSFQTGPTDNCKIAMVKQASSQMETMLGKMESKFLGTLGRVESTVTKVEAVIPKLEESEIDQVKIDQAKANIGTIKVSVATLRTFFLKMQKGMSSWIATAKSNPISAFEQMQAGSMFPEGDSTKAAEAADTMVEAFEQLLNIFDEVEKSQGGG